MWLKVELIEICKLIYEKGFVAATDGNISVRLDSQKILCTPSAVSKGKVKQDELVTVDLEGKVLFGNKKPSTELALHLEIYKSREDVNAVIHAHPIYATGFASSKLALSSCVFPEVILGLGVVPVCTYATPATHEVVDSIKPFLNQTNILLLQNHGAVSFGMNLWDAYYKMEKLEHAAHTLFVAKMLGGENVLTQDQMNQLYEVNENIYKIPQKMKIPCEPFKDE